MVHSSSPRSYAGDIEEPKEIELIVRRRVSRAGRAVRCGRSACFCDYALVWTPSTIFMQIFACLSSCVPHPLVSVENPG